MAVAGSNLTRTSLSQHLMATIVARLTFSSHFKGKPPGGVSQPQLTTRPKQIQLQACFGLASAQFNALGICGMGPAIVLGNITC